MSLKQTSLIGVFIFSWWMNTALAQDTDPGSMRIPDLSLIHGTHSHGYALSPQGLSVFWADGDSLRWMYDARTLAGRGTQLSSDARFAYLFGLENRLTVIDPSLPQGLYATGILPDNPLAVQRIGTRLWLLFRTGKLMQLNLEPTTRLEASLIPVELSVNEALTEGSDSWVGLQSNQHELFLVSQNGVLATVMIKEGKAVLQANIETGLKVKGLFLYENTLLLSTPEGGVYLLEAPTEGTKTGAKSVTKPVTKSDIKAVTSAETPKPLSLGSVEGELTHAYAWKGGWIVRSTRAGMGANAGATIWFLELKHPSSQPNKQENPPETGINVAANKLLLRDDPKAGNHLVVNKNHLWISEYGRLRRFDQVDSILTSFRRQKSAPFRIQALPDLSLPYPQPVLLSFHLESLLAASMSPSTDTKAQIDTTARMDSTSRFEMAQTKMPEQVYWMASRKGISLPMRGNALKWIPQTADIGPHSLLVIAQSEQGAVDSIRVNVTIRPLNRPPYFMPLRPVRILPGEPFRLQLIPIDPDASDRSLIAVQGKNLPEGLVLDPITYELTWTPTEEQRGEYEIILLVSDEFGATASTTLNITVGTP